MSITKSGLGETETSTRIELRNLALTDFLQLRDSMAKAYPTWEDFWTKKQLKKLLTIFPEGQLVVLVNDTVVGVALSIIVDYSQFGNDHTYEQITAQDTFNTHDSDGDVLYGIEIFIHPEYRGMRLGRRLYDARKELCENLNLKSIVFGGRIPKYNEYADEIGPKEYIQKVRRREIYDPTLTFQLSNDFHPLKVLKNYSQGDVDSLEYAVLLEWNNVYYQKKQKVVNQQKTVIRLGLVQWQMRPFKDMDALTEQMEFFVDAVSDYQSDFIVFPEFFNAPLMAPHNHLPESQAIRELAAFSDPLRKIAQEFAVNYNVNIILGSMPYLDGERLLNVGFVCRRDGSYERYEKIHITPSESSAWGMVGGNTVKAIETDCGKIGVLICYDSEFPELSRLLADQGMKILFVPFLTDTPNGFTRVRNCSMARAIENECYVAIAGSVGNLPRVNNMDIQFAQSAVYTPADFAFPTNGIKAEATPNTEMTVIADVDLELLKELHEHGSVRNLKDRRNDLYELKLLPKKS
ncbi:carbon-nitrogen hydrolase family protein [Flavilitoribacter nigricans]|uniref:Carbon-nitrogen hydrolase n=1 Tax=Flavilitoribacter nigricans (strain ATCC 23147 / DSM 23189 / NBRC 102662 / NCIMB 1420 / SS-2) TaxID=1122177 RepID=A0A2D0N3T6_FLAN2|nr:bifunctional GNAT family N-acetyltransferase/carbon-nitrogen hydrolase family protein [Flavilitoribacter nigricans]PHN03050.1 carbon-nitrogen hydrolase [Flavilitoribacter nigricans DSM 23189 = NBRC 102662]